MSVFAPKEAMSDSGNHPPLEVLAAYIDGMLSEEEAARVAEHIAECEDCFFVYSETVRFQLEHPDEEAAPEPNPGEVVAFPTRTETTQERKRPSRRWPAVAVILAAAALAVVIGLSLYRNFGPQSLPQVTTAELIEPVQGAPGVQDRLYKYKVNRGGHGGESELNQQSFVIGFVFVDLRLSLQAGDVETSRELLRKVGVAVQATDVSPDLGLSLLQEAEGLKSPVDLQRFLPEIARWEAEIQAEDGTWLVADDYFTFGKWAEAGRLAADLRKEEFFRDRKNRRVLSYVLASEEMSPSDEVVADLREIKRVWDQGDLQPHDFDTLEDKFESILQTYDVAS